VNGTGGSGLCPMAVSAFSHAQSFVYVTGELVFSCFVSQIPVTVI
jgi:hypothetical protein